MQHYVVEDMLGCSHFYNFTVPSALVGIAVDNITSDECLEQTNELLDSFLESFKIYSGDKGVRV